MGGAVSISPVAGESASHFHDLIGDHEAVARLFLVISVHGLKEGKINLKNRISLPEMLLYMDKGDNPVFKEALPNCPIVVIKTAFESVTEKKSNHEMTKKEFHKFLPVVYLFFHLWKIFDIADSSIDDRRIFPNEFLLVKYNIESIPGVHLAAVTREEWEKEFHILDKNKDGYITFNEFCKYVLSKIVTPQNYIEALKALEAVPSMEEIPCPLSEISDNRGSRTQEAEADKANTALRSSVEMPPSSEESPNEAPLPLPLPLAASEPASNAAQEKTQTISAATAHPTPTAAVVLPSGEDPVPRPSPRPATVLSSPRKTSPRATDSSPGGAMVASRSAVL
jgi:Ca2+-binding EF-hand superfamily protein